MLKFSGLPLQIKLVIVVFVVSAGIFASMTFVYYQDSQVKAGIIKVQIADIEGKIKIIENQTNKIGFLETTVANQSKVIQNQSGDIKQLNFTVFDQKDTIGRQIVELRRRSDQITLLEGNVSLLKGEVQTKEKEIISLTPITKGYFVAAVKSSGGGAIIPLEVKVLPKGTSLLSVNIKNVDLQSGAQESIRLAAAVASQLSRINLNDKDIDVSFVNQFADLVSVDGPSAGGAITATIYAALTQKSITSNTLMTGTIETDGSIGPVGGVDKKAEAARTQGASRFLVPKGQKVDVSGIEVVEVNNINEVLNYLVS